jgi:hypothetical protein
MADNSHLSASGNGEEGDEVPKLPKRPVPAFLLYSQEKRKSLPSMTLQESTQKLSKMWKAASTEEKKVCVCVKFFKLCQSLLYFFNLFFFT